MIELEVAWMLLTTERPRVVDSFAFLNPAKRWSLSARRRSSNRLILLLRLLGFLLLAMEMLFGAAIEIVCSDISTGCGG